MIDELIVNHEKHVSFSPVFEKEHGSYKISFQHPRAIKIKGFTINDVELIRCPQNIMSGDDFSEYIISDGYVPLNIFQAKTLQRQKVGMSHVWLI